MKKCSTCGEVKALDLFKERRAKCRACLNAMARERYASDPDTRERCKASAKKHRKPYAEWSEVSRERKRSYEERLRRENGALSVAQRTAAAQAKARAHLVAKELARVERASRSPQDAHVKAWKRFCSAHAYRHAYRTDPEFNAAEKLRARLRKLSVLDADLQAHISEAVRLGRPSIRWKQVLGYSMQDLVTHLRRTLPRKCTWQQFIGGELHIDHILPRSSFDLTRVDEVRVCWGLANLRLLPAAENIRKGARVEVLL